MSLDRDTVIAALPAYDVGKELGRGAFGIVLSGTHKQLNRPVAIKQLPRAFGTNKDVRRRFLLEARVLASLTHPHIVPIYDYVEQDGVCVLVMELLTGGTVSSRIDTAGLDASFAYDVALAAADGLAYAHDEGVLHRDIKPDNLMFTANGQLKITDFGLAKVLGSNALTATQAGYAFGTPDYMAPEQAQGVELGPPADIYALGTVLFQLVARQLPYPAAGSPVAALYQHVHEEPTPIRTFVPDLDGELALVIDRAIARELDQRYATAVEFRDALAGALEGSPVQRSLAVRAPQTIVGKAVAIPRSKKPSRRTLLAVGGLAIVGIAAGAIALLTGGGGGGGNTGAGEPSSDSEYSVSPTSGAIGTLVTLTSAKNCPPIPKGDTTPSFVYVTLVDPRQVTAKNDGTIYGGQVPLTASRGWTGQVAIPGAATKGATHFHASCFAQDPKYPDPGPYYDYPIDGQFTVTAPSS